MNYIDHVQNIISKDLQLCADNCHFKVSLPIKVDIKTIGFNKDEIKAESAPEFSLSNTHGFTIHKTTSPIITSLSEDQPDKNTEIPTLFLSYCSKDKPIASIVQDKFISVLGDQIAISVYTELPYRSSFREFMNTVQDHDYVLCLVSDHYLKSTGCMYEVGEVVKNRHYENKLFFIVIGEEDKSYYHNCPEQFSPAHLYDSVEIGLDYTQYWKNKCNSIEAKIKETGDSVACTPYYSELAILNKIYQYDIGEFVRYLQDHKGKSLKEHLDENFSEMINQIFSK